MNNLYFLVIEGVIGAGKTSLASIMAEKLSARLVLEKFEENPFLEDFYRDPERYAFQTQLYFLLSRYRQQVELKQIDLFTNLLISDYMFAKDKLFATLNLNEKEISLYNLIAQQLEKDLPKPDLVVYLQASTDHLMANIKKRGRSYEKTINRDYIDSLNQIYNEFFFRYKDSPLIIVNTNEIDFVNNENDLNELIREIRQPVTGTVYYNPLKKT
ncbi:MAG: deoxynucleoside kinase [Candidatus Marinimicrobia bacterium]|jgi:deoxyadenosine/deoxycytidine kinase|nr:deoxynucleoside kinase [Candidatus Neomarinimicrobiota bacterium]MCK9559512.1 deoxynucleoside kinase [Candidatus Neomarinimicrobiota bacterium]MDD5540181.1 deoxynucleoside kinase [Candidatus Neomarinimicrobiota bacterium]